MKQHAWQTIAYESGHRRIHLGGKSADVSGILDTSVDSETLRSVEQIVDHLIAVAIKSERLISTVSNHRLVYRTVSHGGRHEVFDEIVHLCRLDPGLLSQCEGFSKYLETAENDGVSNELECRS